LSDLAHRAAGAADLLVLPEMAATGYLFSDPEHARQVAEPARGPTLAALAPVAREAGVWLVCGFPEREADALFNSALVINPSGELAFVYRKTLLYEADENWARPGDSGYQSFDSQAGRFGVGICMDFNDDRFIDWCTGADLDLVALPTNWLDEGTDVWPYWAWRLSPLPGVTLVAANTWGTEGDIRFSGRSVVLRDRMVHAAAALEGNCAILCDISGPVRPA
jgi:predicted amidohydrolase